MNPIPERETPLTEDVPPANWREAVADLLSARIALIEMEARQAAQGAVRKGLALGILAGAAFFAWALLVVGIIGLLATTFTWGWGWLALAAAALHGIVAGIAIAKLRAPAPPAFTLTRSEFERDREWFKSL